MSDENNPPPTLNYSPSDRAQGGRLVGQAIAGAVTTTVVLMVIVAFILGMWTQSKAAGIVVGIGVLAGVALLGVKATASAAYHGWGIGIWIGLGITILIEGTCFIAMR